MEISVKQRLVEYIEAKGLSIRKFERLANLSNGYIKSLRKSPTCDKMQSIIYAFPDLNTEWLFTGEGDMFLTNEQPSTPPQDESPMQVIAQLTDLLRQSTEENARLRARVIELQNLVSTLSRSTVNYLDIAAEPTSNDNNQA